MASNNVRFAFRLPFALRNLLLRGAAKRTLACYQNAETPSANSLITAVIKSKLNPETDAIDNTFSPYSNATVVLKLSRRLHLALKADAEMLRRSAASLLSDLINNAYLDELTTTFSDEIPTDEPANNCSYQIQESCKTKILHEISRRILINKSTVGRGELPSINDIISELLASKYNLPLPAKVDAVDDYKAGDTFVFLTSLEANLHYEFAKFCEGQGRSLNTMLLEILWDRAKKENWAD